MSSIREDLLPQPGDVIAGHYRVDELLGHGGMGAVFAGKHTRTGRAVAIKWMLPQAAANSEAVARFIAEAKATAKIEHPNVVQIYDFGEADGSPFLVMERLRGRSLREHLDAVGRLTPAEAVHLLVPAMKGVAEAHREGIIHRDIKPDNIFLCRGKDGSPREAKVVDFGISKLYDDEKSSNLTGTGMMMGTPAYMSPEQLNAPKDADARYDVYAFGVVMYEALTGRQPYEADGIFQLVAEIMKAEVVTPSKIVAEIPPVLDQTVLKAMHREMANRFDTMAEMIQAFDALRPHVGLPAIPGVVSPDLSVPFGATMAANTGPLGPQGGSTPFPATAHATPAPGGYGSSPGQHTPPPQRAVQATAVLTPMNSQPGIGSQPGYASQPGGYASQPGGYGSVPGSYPGHHTPGPQTAPGYGVATPMGTPHTPYGTPAPQQKSGGGGMVLAVFAVLALLLGGGGAAGAAIYFNGQGDDPDEPSADVANPPPAPDPVPPPEPSEPAAAVDPGGEVAPPAAVEPPSAAQSVRPRPRRDEPGTLTAQGEPPEPEDVEPEPEDVEPEPEPAEEEPPRRRPQVRRDPPRPVFRPAPAPPSPVIRRPPPRPSTPRSQRGANGAMIIE